MINFVNKLLSSISGNTLNKYKSFVESVNHHEKDLNNLSDHELAAKTKIFKEQVKNKIDLDKYYLRYLLL